MPSIELSARVSAPVERVFDLSLSIDLHLASTAHTGERVIAGVMTGLMALGQEVTWSARHFGVRQRLTSRITALDRPSHFRDSMVRGAFRRFDHDHYFTATDGGTIMRDVFDYTAPFGPLGALADALFLKGYMRRLLLIRNQTIKEAAESEVWRKYL
jgi:ligand-binding SRPBCC domain-containing protein